MNKEALEIMKNGKQEERIYIASKSFGMFAVYYFSDYFKYSLAPYHYEMIKELERLEKGEDIRELVFIMFRESGKTVFSKLFIIWLIVFNKRKYINVDSFDKENAERIFFGDRGERYGIDQKIIFKCEKSFVIRNSFNEVKTILEKL